MNLSLLHQNNQDLDLLDWHLIVNEITSFAHLDSTKDLIKINPKSKTAEEIKSCFDDLSRFLENAEDNFSIFNENLRNLPSTSSGFSNIEAIKKGKYFDCSELNSMALLFEAYIKTFKFYSEFYFSTELKIGPEIFQKIKRQFLNPLREFVDYSGQPHFERHPILKKLYAEVLEIENDLRISIQRIAKSDLFSERLQLDNFDIINDRYVLAIRSDSYNADLGPIVARSNSGMTLFVEPYEIRVKSNKRIHLLAEIESIILKLTNGLSEVLHPHFSETKKMADFILGFDHLNTKAHYTKEKDLTRPEIVNRPSLEFIQMFHPLIKNPVKNDLSITQNKHGMIISGPNTGGKTVVLKTVAISLLFVHQGLFVPANKAIIYPFENLYYFSHDHQNLEAGLSSFASEAKYYLELLHSLGPTNLILVDEIFNSTSSEEASALAIAFLDELHQRSKSKIVLSTHHQVLKTFMHGRNDYVSSHVGFNYDTNMPTYKLIVGEPGSSLAFKIFDNLQRKFSFTSDISEKAKTLLDQKQVTYESLLEDLSFKKTELDRLISHNSNLNKELRNQKQAMEGVLHLEKEKLLQDFQRRLKKTMEEAENLFQEIKNDKIQSTRQLQNKIFSIKANINDENDRPRLKPTDDQIEKYAHFKDVIFDDIAVDQTLFAINLGKNVKVAQLNPKKKEVQVKHGSLLVWLPVFNLRYPSGGLPPRKAIINIERETLGKIDIDCRGMRLDDFKNICEKAIQDLYDGEIPFVTIVHGHGTGILKNWLRDYLRREHKDLRFENIEGNDGCTKIMI